MVWYSMTANISHIVCKFISAYVPYCSSDVYTGTKYRTEGDQGFYFHGHYIVNAILDDLIENTWITEAEEVSIDKMINF